MNKEDLTKDLFSPLDYISGVSSRFILQRTLDKDLYKEIYEQNYQPYPEQAIVRRVEDVKDYSELRKLNQIELKDKLVVSTANLPVYRVLVEVKGVTERYIDFFRGNLSKDVYFSSLLEVYVQKEGRIPIKDEIVRVKYDNEINFLSIRFNGFPAEKVRMDPNLAKYVRKTNSARSSFPEGA